MASAKRHPETIPGTVHLVDLSSGTGGDGIVELVPRPSSDPEDPLNWTRARKYKAMVMVLVYTLGIGIPTTLQYSVLADITRDTGISTASLVQGTGLMFLFLGWGCLVTQPFALTYGRRGVYLVSLLATVPLMVWTAYSTSAGEWYAHRIVLGLFASPIEALPEVSIPDIFFAHERGSWMSLYVFALFGSNFVAPIMAGFFAEAYGWRWTMHFGAMIAALAFVIVFFFMEETMYFRNTLEGLEDESQRTKGGDEGVMEQTMSADASKKSPDGGSAIVTTDTTSGSVENVPQKYVRALKPFRRLEGRPVKKQMFQSMVLPLFIIVQFPTVAWAGFIYGINLSWYNVINATTSPVLSAAPYLWSTRGVGLMYLGPLIGAAFGCLWSGVIADRLALMLARRNKGVREPEQRLWPLALSAVLSCVGLIVWGVGAQHDVHWAGLAIGLAILTFSCVTGGSIALSYNVDCFKDISGESTTSIIIIRNTLGFAISYGITPWYTDMGLQDCFILAGFLSLGCTLTFLVMVWKGKSLRRHAAQQYWRYVEKGLVSVE
ncbi:MFS transporter [Cordyceps militaris]|uniref:MFS transporter n=1 Tax=Cordyceps militaris TaxID=73501 RepID=A0A2H4SR38_CORMI|nr:MFS transporter [Cordyceps militaris]